MNSLLQYLLNVSFSILPFYLLYLLCFRRLTFFNWNRWYILASLIISALIPLISFPSGENHYLPVQNLPFLPQPAAMPATRQLPVTTVAPFDWSQLLLTIYMGGVLVTATSLLSSLARITKMIRNNAGERTHGYRIIKSEDVRVNASFFGYIFLQPSLNTEEAFTVIMHEDAHARRRHTLDILLLEMFKIFLWFHPALYHYKKLLQEAHEFEVDRETALVTNKKDYAHLLLKLQGGRTPSLVNSYNSTGITQRIKMLFAERTKGSRKMAYLLVLPCLAVITMYCSKKTTDLQASFIEVTHGEYGIFEESPQELRYILNPQKIKRMEDYHAFLYGEELKKISRRFGQYHVNVRAFTYSKTTGPTEECGMILYGKREVMAGFKMDELLKQNLSIELSVNKSTGEAQVHSVTQQAPAERDSDKYKAVIENGQQLFAANCAACHKVEKDMTGPALSGIENRRTKEWLYQYIRNSNDLLRAGDSTALQLYSDWDKTPMNAFPHLKNKDIDAMLAYIRSAE
ncbi:MAG: c-type cytochrome [Niastella sp.]|nr:c-type cytochrome [Niastella sp.]